jgi:rRNA maturation endonuclease Nob1
VFDTAEFKSNVPSEDEEEYLASKRKDAEIMLEQQNCRHLREYLEQEYRSDIQEQASTLKDFKFTGSEVQKLLNNLLHERSQDLESSSVKDIIALIKTLADQGALQSDDNFSSHFIHVYPPFDVVCTSCGREFDIVKGLDAICPHCKQVYRWSEEERRFYPELAKL